jgi:uncharacterized protein YbjQ (UPF0145 family)
MKGNLKAILAVSLLAVLPGCATWSHSSVDNKAASAAVQATDPAKVVLSEGDMNRKYSSLGDVSVTVNKTTIFNRDPTRDDVNAKLREEAAKLGADAVIHVRYGDGGVSLMSWGSLEGKGRAVKFQ